MVEGKLELFFPCKLGSKVQSNEVSRWILLFGKAKIHNFQYSPHFPFGCNVLRGYQSKTDQCPAVRMSFPQRPPGWKLYPRIFWVTPDACSCCLWQLQQQALGQHTCMTKRIGQTNDVRRETILTITSMWTCCLMPSSQLGRFGYLVINLS